MYFPCPSCGTSTRITTPSSTDAPSLVLCTGCGNRIRVVASTPEDSFDKEQYRRAQRFALENQIDLPTAYSVLEGLFTLAEAHGGIEPPHAPPDIAPLAAATRGGRGQSPPAATPGSDEQLPYDPGFAEAIRDGCLNIQQAMERGDRQALASRLAARHLLPMDLALQAADHRVTIRQAILQRAARVEQDRPAPSRTGAAGALLFTVVAAGAVAVLMFAGMRFGGARGAADAVAPATSAAPSQQALTQLLPNDSDRVQAGPTVTKSDSDGRLLRVAAPDPKSVLVGFCANGRRADLKEPIGIAEADPPAAGRRLGIFHTQSNPPLRAIRIWKDETANEWVAGDGRSPIQSEAVPGTQPADDATPRARSAATEAAAVRSTDG